MDIRNWLANGVRAGASDVHLSAGMPPLWRIDGTLHALPDTSVLSADAVRALLLPLLNPTQWAHVQQQRDADLACTFEGVGRCRLSVFHQQRGLAAVFRLIPTQLPTLAAIGISDTLRRIADLPQGLALITGPTGSGKSTTLAALIDDLNQREARHILTLEDPIEFIHTPARCLINQREITHDAASFASGLRAALREDPDIVLIGELRDLDSIRLALTAAETGHLVLATLHTRGAIAAIDRLIDVFPAEEKATVRTQLAGTLQAVVSQQLLARDGGGRVAAHEVLWATSAIRNLIRENRSAQMLSVLQTGAALGMQTFEASLNDLHRRGLIRQPAPLAN